MKFVVCYEYRGANYHAITSGRGVASLRSKYYVYSVKRYK